MHNLKYWAWGTLQIVTSFTKSCVDLYGFASVCVSGGGLLKVCVWQIQDSGFLESGVPSWLVEDPYSFVSFTGRSLVHNVLWMGPTYKYWSRLFWGMLSKKYLEEWFLPIIVQCSLKNTLMILFIIALSSNVEPISIHTMNYITSKYHMWSKAKAHLFCCQIWQPWAHSLPSL